MALAKLENYYPNYREHAPHEYDITHFNVIAEGDEQVGSVDTVLVDEDSGDFRYLVVDTGFWVLGKKVILPIALGHPIYMDRRIYVNSLTKDQVKQLPEYDEGLTVNPDYEEQVRSVLRPIVENAIANEAYDPDTYDLSQEPYFYDPDDETMKSVQEQLVATKQQREQNRN